MGFLNEPVIKAYAHLISIMRFFLQAHIEKETFVQSFYRCGTEVQRWYPTRLWPPHGPLSEPKSFITSKSTAFI